MSYSDATEEGTIWKSDAAWWHAQIKSLEMQETLGAEPGEGGIRRYLPGPMRTC